MRKIAPVLALALVMSLALDGVALAAGGARTTTTFRMRDEGSFVTYKGRVDSSDRCIKSRVVEVWHNGVKIAETTTNENGNWVVDGPVPPNGDQVKVIVKAKRRDGRTICRKGSNVKTFRANG